ncbi:hypothetical protein TVAG_263930 [Trichomonas vaginalis G3]|uniref:Mic1 domain-containing protein n=1 Tax=Trichomonas vaginalis (strain ATCC PRA-98 / G3) TaxID=412133 RepID=A2EP19_TRIV3|nr:hypothetical protein TVAGG3_0945720 [Trichomonas vaginalis G3]EAY05623.1 hypothetical protein TVAG_263930 [Trichomonas vaginalis G3]KAI5486863.1 hypothetical protein TVAGG3_0945720 [Trichomonas vaginalis G3]|eukprot:XP_001317846.1 hypothetical protein [Trichomonas vaginalis G3]
MLQYTSAFNPQRLKEEKQARVRILDSSIDGKLLVQINTPKQTSIELVSEDGSSMTAVSFNKFADFVTANLSRDNELLILVERIPSPKGFCFSSKIMHIFGSQVSKEIISEHPISGKFIDINPAKGYQMLHIMGTKLTHLNVILTKTSIECKVIRGGLNIPSLIAYHYFRDSATLAAVFVDDKIYKFAHFHITEDGVKSKPPIPITVSEKSMLPPELALNATSQLHLPVFRTQLRRFFFEKCNRQVFIIQQLFDRNDSALSFSIISFPIHFSQIISIPGVSPDHPICSLHFSNMLIIYAPNLFICVVDMSCTPPIISLMPSSLCNSICSTIASNIPITNSIVDLDTNEIYKVSIDTSNIHLYERSFDRFTLPTISVILARQLDSKTICSIMKSLLKFKDKTSILTFIHSFLKDFCGPDSRSRRSHQLPTNVHKVSSLQTIKEIQPERSNSQGISYSRKKVPQTFLPTIESIEKEFPSPGTVTRSVMFKRIFQQIASESKEKSPEVLAEKAMKFIRRQNEASICLRQSLDLLSEDETIDKADIVAIKIAIASEIVFESLPSIACLTEEIALEADNYCSKPVKYALSAYGITGRIFPQKEAVHWKKRIPQYIFDTSVVGTSSTSDSSWSSSIISSHFMIRSQSKRIGSIPHNFMPMSTPAFT